MSFSEQADAVNGNPEAPLKAEGGWTLHACYTLVLLHIVYAFNYFDRLLISILFPLIQEDLGFTDTELGLVTGVAFVLIYGLMGIPIARLADKYSRKTIIGVGFTFWSTMTFVTGYVSNFWQMAAARFAMGAGEAAGTPPSTSMLSDLFDEKRRPLAFSIMASGTAVSGLILTPAAGWIGEHHGWRTAYFAAGAIGIFFGILFYLTAKEPKRGQFDKKSAAETVEQPPFFESVKFLLSRRVIVLATIAVSLVMISYYAHIVWSMTFMKRVHGMDVAASSALLGPVRGIFGLIGALGAGVLLAFLKKSDNRWSVWLPAICGVVVGLAQFFFLFGPTPAIATIGVGLDSMAAGMMVPLMSLLLIQVMPPEVRALGMALYILAISIISQVVGPLGVGALNDSLAGIWGDEAIRYSMTITAIVGALSGPVLIMAGRYLGRDVTEADHWKGD